MKCFGLILDKRAWGGHQRLIFHLDYLTHGILEETTNRTLVSLSYCRYHRFLVHTQDI